MEARTSRYHEVYARWQRDPEGFWGEAAQEIDWIEPPKKVFDPDAGVYGRWFVGGVCNTCWNAVDRHVMAGRGDQPAIIYDSPLAGVQRTISYDRLWTETQMLGRDPARLRRRQGRPRHPLHADGAGSGDRDARLRAHRRGAFGGVRRLRGARACDPHRRRQAEAHPVARAAASSPAASSSTSRCSTRRSSSRRHKPDGVPHPAAAAGGSGAHPRPRSRLGGVARPGDRTTPSRSRLRAARGHRPALHPLHLRHDRAAQRRSARQWRPHGRAQMVDAELSTASSPARSSGPRPMSAG